MRIPSHTLFRSVSIGYTLSLYFAFVATAAGSAAAAIFNSLLWPLPLCLWHSYLPAFKCCPSPSWSPSALLSVPQLKWNLLFLLLLLFKWDFYFFLFRFGVVQLNLQHSFVAQTNGQPCSSPPSPYCFQEGTVVICTKSVWFVDRARGQCREKKSMGAVGGGVDICMLCT